MTQSDDLLYNSRFMDLVKETGHKDNMIRSYRELVERMLDYFQVIPQTSTGFKLYKRKLGVFEKQFEKIKTMK